MTLPDLSYMMTVGQLRYIQSVFESPGFRNPDSLVSEFLPALQRLSCLFRGCALLPRIRSRPFYYYVLARTKYYDAVFVDAICEKFDFVVNIGCGSDTRAYRFGHLLQQKGMRVLECDQPQAIFAKQKIARGKWPVEHVEYLPIDLNADSWPEFENWLRRNSGAKMLVMMEGVSPYVNNAAFERFLGLLSSSMQPGSRLAYDFKLRGIADGFGRSVGTEMLFRLSDESAEVLAFHEARGFRLENMELSSELALRLLPRFETPLFREDCLVRLALVESKKGRAA